MIWLIVSSFLLAYVLMAIYNRHKLLQVRDKLGLKGPPTTFLWGNMDMVFKNIRERGIESTVKLHRELVEQYGKTFGVYWGARLEIVTVEPEYVKEIFISQFSNFVDRKSISINMQYPLFDGLLAVTEKGRKGAGWKEMRSVISAIFTSGKMKKMHLLFQDQLVNLMESMRTRAKKPDGSIDIYAEYQAMTMDMISRCALGQNISCIKDRENTYYMRARHFLANAVYHGSTIFQLSIYVRAFGRLRRWSNFGRSEHILVEDLSKIIRLREKERAAGTIRPLPDLLDLILAENEKRVENGHAPLHHDIVVSNAWALFLAGYETTSTALSYASFLLAQHPEIQQLLYEEVIQTFGEKEVIDYERVMKMPYLDAVFNETLRLYPPVVTFTARTCTKETYLGGGKLLVPKGVNLLVPVHVMHRLPELYEQPDEFIPDRFLNEKTSWTSTYLPFGIGPRNCVGARFAEMEFKTVLAEVTRHFKQLPDPAQSKMTTFNANLLQTPLGNKVFVRLEERPRSGLIINPQG